MNLFDLTLIQYCVNAILIFRLFIVNIGILKLDVCKVFNHWYALYCNSDIFVRCRSDIVATCNLCCDVGFKTILRSNQQPCVELYDLHCKAFLLLSMRFINEHKPIAVIRNEMKI